MRKTLFLALAAATLVAAAVRAQEILPASGPLPATTMKRLLLVDASRAGARVVAVGDRGYIVLSDDQGATWRRAKSPEAPLLTAIRFVDEKHGWAVGHDSVILATNDGGETWTRQFSAPAEQRPLLGVLFLDALRGFAVGAYGAFYETVDGGAKWTARKITNDDKHLNAIVDAGKGTLVILGETGTILRSADAGATWQAVPPPYKGSFFGGILTQDGSLAAFGLRGRVYRSADAGRSWTQVPAVTDFSLMNATLLPDGAVVIAGGGGTVLVSRDNAQSFARLSAGRVGMLGKALPKAPDVVMLLGEAGVRELRLTSQPR